jgi:hypothetical protein
MSATDASRRHSSQSGRQSARATFARPPSIRQCARREQRGPDPLLPARRPRRASSTNRQRARRPPMSALPTRRAGRTERVIPGSRRPSPTVTREPPESRPRLCHAWRLAPGPAAAQDLLPAELGARMEQWAPSPGPIGPPGRVCLASPSEDPGQPVGRAGARRRGRPLPAQRRPRRRSPSRRRRAGPVYTEVAMPRRRPLRLRPPPRPWPLPPGPTARPAPSEPVRPLPSGARAWSSAALAGSPETPTP